MSYDEEHQERRRIVVETPAARREVVETHAVHGVPERRGVSTGVVAIVALAAVVLTAMVVWALTRPNEDEININARSAAVQPTPITTTTIVPVPVTQPQQPVVMPPTTTTQPIIVPVPATTTTTTSSSTDTSSASNDSTVQSNIEKKLSDDPQLRALGITVSVLDGKVTLMGTVDSTAMKDRIERMARIKGVKSVDNQIVVTNATDSRSQD